MLDLGFLVMLFLWSAGVGLWCLRRFGRLPTHPADALALALPLGLGALGMGLFGLGEVGALGPRGVRGVLAAGAIPGLLGWRGLALRMRDWSGAAGPWRLSAVLPEWPDRAFAALAAVALAGTLVTSLAPVTDGDALCYHLQVARLFLERGALFFDPDLHETVYPLLTEMLYTAALALRGPVACRLVQWLLGVVFALNVASLARPDLGRRAWWAGAVALLVPAVSNGMTAPLNDVALAAFGTSALVAWSRFAARPGWRAAALTGVLAGLAMGVKYPALVLAGLIALSVGPGLLARTFFRLAMRGGLGRDGGKRMLASTARLVDLWSHDDPAAPTRRLQRGRLRHALAFAMAAWLVGGCWYARAFWHTGNPVYPFFRQTFGGAGLDVVLGAEKRPLAVSTWNLMTALGPMTLRPDLFDSFSHQFGPVFLLFLPALLLERPPRRVLILGGLGYAFLALCLTQRQSMRFVLTALGPLSVAVAWLACQWWERRSFPGRALVGLLVLALGFESALAVARARHGLPVVLGIESAETYLSRREPTFAVGRWVDGNLPREARIVGQDHRGFYIPRAYTMELAHRRRTGLGASDESAIEIVASLRREGFTHLLLCPPEPETAVEFDGTLSRRLGPWLDRRRPVYRAALADADGVVRRYALYEIAPPRVAGSTHDAGVARASSAGVVR